MKKLFCLVALMVVVALAGGCSCSVLATRKPKATATPQPTEDAAAHQYTFEGATLPAGLKVIQYVTLENSSDYSLNEGILTLADNTTDRAPILITDPIPLEQGDIITVSRRVRLQHANDYFTGALRITGVNSETLNQVPDDAGWYKSLGQMLATVDYYYYFYMEDQKPVTDGFVLSDVSEGGYSAAETTNSVFGNWFTETLTYNTATGAVTWNLNGTQYTAQGLPLTQNYICVQMHCYGWFTGHTMDIDTLQISVTKP